MPGKVSIQLVQFDKRMDPPAALSSMTRRRAPKRWLDSGGWMVVNGGIKTVDEGWGEKNVRNVPLCFVLRAAGCSRNAKSS